MRNKLIILNYRMALDSYLEGMKETFMYYFTKYIKRDDFGAIKYKIGARFEFGCAKMFFEHAKKFQDLAD